MVKVLLTGAMGNIGSETLLQFLNYGHEVTGFDLPSKAGKDMHTNLSKKHNYKMVWGDITNIEDVRKALKESEAEAVLHLAAIIPPVAYFRPGLSEKVNVGGTKTLYEEAMKMDTIPRFVFSSSYSCCGTHNPHANEPEMTGETPANAAELYGRQKQTCERLIKENFKGDWVILRFCRVLNTSYDVWAVSKQTLEFAYSNPADQPVHGCHPRDVGLACVNACIKEEAVGKILPIGGDDSWKSTAGEFQNCLMGVMGIGKLNPDVHRKANPELDSTWGFETHIDTTEAQKLLEFQNISFDEYLKEFRSKMFPLNLGAKLVAYVIGVILLCSFLTLLFYFNRPFIRSYFYNKIRYYKENIARKKSKDTTPSEQPYWEDLRVLFPGTPLSFAEPDTTEN